MSPFELLAVLIFAGAIIILFYIFMQDKELSFSSARSGITETSEKARSTISGTSRKIKDEDNNGGFKDAMSGISEKTRSAFTGASDKVKILLKFCFLNLKIYLGY